MPKPSQFWRWRQDRWMRRASDTCMYTSANSIHTGLAVGYRHTASEVYQHQLNTYRPSSRVQTHSIGGVPASTNPIHTGPAVGYRSSHSIGGVPAPTQYIHAQQLGTDTQHLRCTSANSMCTNYICTAIGCRHTASEVLVPIPTYTCPTVGCRHTSKSIAIVVQICNRKHGCPLGKKYDLYSAPYQVELILIDALHSEYCRGWKIRLVKGLDQHCKYDITDSTSAEEEGWYVRGDSGRKKKWEWLRRKFNYKYRSNRII